MAENGEQKGQRGAPKAISLKEDGYYSNCIMVEYTPFDISILFGKLRPRPDEKGEPTLVELYEKQVYLSHLQAKALHESLGRSLAALAGHTAPAAPSPTKMAPAAATSPPIDLGTHSQGAPPSPKAPQAAPPVPTAKGRTKFTEGSQSSDLTGSSTERSPGDAAKEAVKDILQLIEKSE